MPQTCRNKARLSFVIVGLLAMSQAVRSAVPTTVNGMYAQSEITPFSIGTCVGEGPGCSGVYGMDWLSDGRMVLLTSDFQGHNPKPRDARIRSKVTLLSGLPNGPVVVEDIATHFKLPTGLVVVNDRIWVTDMDTVYSIPNNAPAFTGNVENDTLLRMNNRQRRFGTPLPTMYGGNNAPTNFAFPEANCYVAGGQSGCTNLNSNSHHYVFTPVFHQGKFYASYGGATKPGTGMSDLNASSFFAGALLAWDSTTTVLDSNVNRAGGGLRSPDGNTLAPDGSIFVGDNQGSWLPMNTITRFHPFTNQFAGYRQAPTYTPNWAQAGYDRGAMTYVPPVAINRYDQNNRTGWVALTQPYFLSRGPYAGDLLVGDINSRGLWRVAFDTLQDTTGTVNLQGAVFYFTPGSPANVSPALGTGNNGMNRITQGPDGTIYAGALRGVGNWGSGAATNLIYAFRPQQSPNHFEIRRIRSLQDGYELILNRKVNPATVTVANFTVGQRSWVRQAGYGAGFSPANIPNNYTGAAQYANRPVSSVAISNDSMRIRLVVPNIRRINQDRRGDSVTHWHTQFEISAAVTSASGAPLYTTEAAYAQNWNSSRAWDPTLITSVAPQKISTLNSRVWVTAQAGVLSVHTDRILPFEATLRDMRGRLMARKKGDGVGLLEFQAPAGSPAVYTLEIRALEETWRKVVLF
jgi:hypothetical protein